MSNENKVKKRFPFGILSIVFAVLEWAGFGFSLFVVPAIIGYVCAVIGIALGILGIIFGKKPTSIVGLSMAALPIVIGFSVAAIQEIFN